jgi:hypothetical protein
MSESQERSAALRELVEKWRATARTHARYVTHRGKNDAVAIAHQAKSGRLSRCADELEAILLREAAASLSPPVSCSCGTTMVCPAPVGTSEGIRELHRLFDAAIRHENGVTSLCDGPTCRVCALVLREAASLSPQPTPELVLRERDLIARWRKKATNDTQFSNEIWRRTTLRACASELEALLDPSPSEIQTETCDRCGDIVPAGWCGRCHLPTTGPAQKRETDQ